MSHASDASDGWKFILIDFYVSIGLMMVFCKMYFVIIINSFIDFQQNVKLTYKSKNT